MAEAANSDPSSGVTRWLQSTSTTLFSGYVIVAAFSTYFCMYAFRKPFAVGEFAGVVDLAFLPPIQLKILLSVSQVIGYCLSKFIGIKVISEMGGKGRALAIIGCIAAAELALLLFAIVPPEYGFFCLFLNGLPLGMVWGLVFGFLEGRRVSEILGAGLSASYILASGAVKSVGKWTMGLGISEQWMPFATGALFFPALVLFVWMLRQIPGPTAEDEAARTRREPMNGPQRVAFLKTFAPGLIPLTLLYMLLTAYRDFRDVFASDIWKALGHGDDASIFTATEVPIAFAVLLALAAVYRIKGNKSALMIIHAVMLAGSLLIGISTALWQAGMLGDVAWMVMVGLGLYLGYVPYGCVLFDRLIASVGLVATAGFMIYVTDAFGYLGSVGLQLYKNFGEPDLSWLDFFVTVSYVTSAVCSVCFLLSMAYFSRVKMSEPEGA